MLNSISVFEKICKKHLLQVALLLLLLGCGSQVRAQVNSNTTNDTIVIYEEEIVYDTLFVAPGDSLYNVGKNISERKMEQEDAEFLHLLSKGVRLGYADEETGDFRSMKKEELQTILSSHDYKYYQKGRNNYAGAYTLFAFGTAGVGLTAWTGYRYFHFKKEPSTSEFAVTHTTRGRFAAFLGSAVGTVVCFVAGARFCASGRHFLRRACTNFNGEYEGTHHRVIVVFGGNSTGVGLTLNF